MAGAVGAAFVVRFVRVTVFLTGFDCLRVFDFIVMSSTDEMLHKSRHH